MSKATEDYNKHKNGFSATGVYYQTSGMYYTAIHPTAGVWLSSRNYKTNEIMPIGFVGWDNIAGIDIDPKKRNIYVKLKDKQPVLDNLSWWAAFRLFGLLFYTMSQTNEYAIKVDLTLCTSEFLSELSNHFEIKRISEPITAMSIFNGLLNVVLMLAVVVGALILILTVLF